MRASIAIRKLCSIVLASALLCSLMQAASGQMPIERIEYDLQRPTKAVVHHRYAGLQAAGFELFLLLPSGQSEAPESLRVLDPDGGWSVRVEKLPPAAAGNSLTRLATHAGKPGSAMVDGKEEETPGTITAVDRDRVLVEHVDKEKRSRQTNVIRTRNLTSFTSSIEDEVPQPTHQLVLSYLGPNAAGGSIDLHVSYEMDLESAIVAQFRIDFMPSQVTYVPELVVNLRNTCSLPWTATTEIVVESGQEQFRDYVGQDVDAGKSVQVVFRRPLQFQQKLAVKLQPATDFVSEISWVLTSVNALPDFPTGKINATQSRDPARHPVLRQLGVGSLGKDKTEKVVITIPYRRRASLNFVDVIPGTPKVEERLIAAERAWFDTYKVYAADLEIRNNIPAGMNLTHAGLLVEFQTDADAISYIPPGTSSTVRIASATTPSATKLVPTTWKQEVRVCKKTSTRYDARRFTSTRLAKLRAIGPKPTAAARNLTSIIREIETLGVTRQKQLTVLQPTEADKPVTQNVRRYESLTSTADERWLELQQQLRQLGNTLPDRDPDPSILP